MKKNLLSFVFSALMVSVAFGQTTDITVKNSSFEDSTDGTSIIKAKIQYMNQVDGWASVDTALNHGGVEDPSQWATDGGYDGKWAAYLSNKAGGDSGLYQVTGEKIPAEGAKYSLDFFYEVSYSPVDTVYAVAYLAARVSGHNVRIGDTLAALMTFVEGDAKTSFSEATLVSSIPAGSAHVGDSLVIGFNNVSLDHGQKNSWCHIDMVSLTKTALVSVKSMTASSEVRLSPNFVDGIAKLTSPNPIGNATATIYNSAGQQVLSLKITSNVTQLNLSSLRSGIYILQLTNGNSSNELKFVKK
jgi:Secretion system C-terminal sorting domain